MRLLQSKPKPTSGALGPCGTWPALLVLFAALGSACSPDRADRVDSIGESAPAAAAPVFVGGQSCAGCHAEQHARWLESHHSASMAIADPSSVLGDFDNTTFEYNGLTSTFFIRDGQYWVNTDGADGELADFRITHTFGFYPLQQYLVELPDGRYQALSIAWDSRPESDGGQRWFHLYPDEAIVSSDPLHWTGTYQRWNTMCAECHSTNLDKNFDPASATFATTWTSIDVDCEACHGPGSAHVEAPLDNGLLLPHVDRAWVFVGDAAIASLQAGASRQDEIAVCAGCHSRRSQLTDDTVPGEDLLDAYRPALLEAGLYYADGQIEDEVYVYGSFVQSRMYTAGVSCSDCHEPHSASLRAEGNALCGQCHRADVFDTPQHHHHAEGSHGAECVSCHMRAKTYMVVDPRRDHSFRVPRPDLSASLDSPNACQDCHADKTADWATEAVAGWYPEGRALDFHYGQAIAAGRQWSADRAAFLRAVIEDDSQAAIVRASAITLLAEQLDGAALDIIERELQGDEPIVQLAALDALANVPVEMRIELAQRFLDHELLALRISAARRLLQARDALSDRRRADLDAALEEYLAAQRFNSDRAEGVFNLASVAAEQGRLDEAERTYLLAIEREPAFAASYVNLADLYRQTGREDEGNAILREGLALAPDDPGLLLSLGLSRVRSGDSTEALALFARAAELADDSPYYRYVLGVALYSSGDRQAALDVLARAHESFPSYRELLVALATMHRDAGNIAEATEYALRLRELAPTDASVRSLLDELEELGRQR